MIEGSLIPEQCGQTFEFEGQYVWAPGGDYIIDACPCDQDCNQEDLHVISKPNGEDVWAESAGCVVVRGSTPGCSESSLLVIETDGGEWSCGVILASHAYEGDPASLPDLMIDEPKLHMEIVDREECLHENVLYEQYSTQLLAPESQDVYVGEGELWADCGGFTVWSTRFRRARVVDPGAPEEIARYSFDLELIFLNPP
jgi:hypothetical protein